MRYISTRGGKISVSAAEAIIKGIAPDGGLLVPEHIPRVDDATWAFLKEATYQEVAACIFRYFLEDFTEDEINDCVRAAYNEDNFDDPLVAPLKQIDPALYIQELWHGPTAAFKDMALQILPFLMRLSMEKTGTRTDVLILVATSGDTGKAALEGFKDVGRTKIMVFYPGDGVSEVQKRQMITQEGNNVFVVAVDGNFDDAQRGVKEIFADREINRVLAEKNIMLSSANSINWGRLLPQIVYYFTAYLELLKREALQQGESFNVVVPTGNFGNILGAYYARTMGVPIQRLICAANSNNVLTEFIRTGHYNRKRELVKTSSPSMDILVSSNLERLLYEINRHNDAQVRDWMQKLEQNGAYEIDRESLKLIQDVFWSDYAADQDATRAIEDAWHNHGYLLDPHTAVAWHVWQTYRGTTGDGARTVIVSTASPFKFAGSVAPAVLGDKDLKERDEFEVIHLLARRTGLEIPHEIQVLEEKPVRHHTTTPRDKLAQAVLSLLETKKE